MWNTQIVNFKNYLKLEKSLSKNTLISYVCDLEKFKSFLVEHYGEISFFDVKDIHIREFLQIIHENGIEATSQSRLISSLRAFFKFLIMDQLIKNNPMELIETPKVTRKIPDVLTFEEIETILHTFDLSTAQGQRNRAMLETLYASGLRVTEMVNLTFDDYYPKEGFLRVLGKGDKQRLVPIGESAIQQIQFYIQGHRALIKVKPGFQKYIFLNKNGKNISRIHVFMVIKEAAIKAEIEKEISPHTFRHSFATHLIEGGANLKAVQDMLGHESITTTEIYTHLDNEYLRSTLLQHHPLMKNNKI
jgi:integrase/recombinase XerD